MGPLLEVISPGFLTLLQDNGRIGYGAYGVPKSGPMDPFAYKIANLLVNNKIGTPCLEVTLNGPTLKVLRPAIIAITGGRTSFTINNIDYPLWTTVLVRPGDLIKIGNIEAGCRCYLAVRGGIDGHKVMGSFSTYLPAGIGGFNGQALAGKTILSSLANTENYQMEPFEFFTINREYLINKYNKEIRYIRNYNLDNNFFLGLTKESWKVSNDSNRIGIRLVGRSITGNIKEIASTGVAMGVIQLPAGGQPIILGADAQTIGGYTILGKTIVSDFCKLGQLVAGDEIKFLEISIEEAQRILIEEENKYHHLLIPMSRRVVFTKSNYYDITIEGE